MTITFALTKYFVSAFLVGMGVGVSLKACIRLVNRILNVTD